MPGPLRKWGRYLLSPFNTEPFQKLKWVAEMFLITLLKFFHRRRGAKSRQRGNDTLGYTAALFQIPSGFRHFARCLMLPSVWGLLCPLEIKLESHVWCVVQKWSTDITFKKGNVSFLVYIAIAERTGQRRKPWQLTLLVQILSLILI